MDDQLGTCPQSQSNCDQNYLNKQIFLAKLIQGPPGMSDEETSEDDEDGETDGEMMVNVKINIDKSE